MNVYFRNNSLLGFIICILFFTLFVSAKSSSREKNKPLIGIKDTIQVINKTTFNNTPKEENEVVGFNWEKNMPWIAAIFVGISTVLANILISTSSRRSTKESIEKQIENAKEISLAQIATALKNNERDFNKTVLSGNRQLWINELRDAVSKFLAISSTFMSKQNLTNADLEDLRFLFAKIELLLNAEDDKEFIETIAEMENRCMDVLIKVKDINDLELSINKIKALTKKTLKTEWEKVKLGI